jgi:hypothetical protein
MKNIKTLTLTAVAVICLMIVAVPKMQAQVNVNIGVAPDCPYGYYDYAPYACAPYGYYGPEWFSGGVFIGAGPWFHGEEHFVGHVDNRLDVHHGYKGPMPKIHDKPEPSRHFDKIDNFRGNEMRDGRGHVTGGEKR